MSASGQFPTHATQRGDRDRTLPDGRFVKRACSVDRDHDVGSLDHQADAAVHLDAELVDCLVGDRGRQDISADVDANMRSSRAFLDFDYDAPDVVACTDAHGDPPSIFSHWLQPEQTETSPLGARLHREKDIALCMFGGNQIIRSAAVPMTANGMVRPCSRPACSECWQGAPKTGARHVTETRQLARRNRHRYRQELVPHRWPKSARCRRAAAEMVA